MVIAFGIICAIGRLLYEGVKTYQAEKYAKAHPYKMKGRVWE